MIYESVHKANPKQSFFRVPAGSFGPPSFLHIRREEPHLHPFLMHLREDATPRQNADLHLMRTGQATLIGE